MSKSQSVFERRPDDVRPPVHILPPIDFPPGHILKLHILLVFGLFALNAGAMFWQHVLGFSQIEFFLMDMEANLPTFFSTLILLEAALISLPMYFLERQRAGRFRRHWLLIAALLAFMALDEVAQIHEKTQGPIRNALGLSGAFHFSWVVLGLPAAGIVAAFFVPLLRSLERHVALMIGLSGAIFLAGAVGLEMVGGYIMTTVHDNRLYLITSSFEETLEMVGVSVYVYALLTLNRAQGAGWCIFFQALPSQNE